MRKVELAQVEAGVRVVEAEEAAQVEPGAQPVGLAAGAHLCRPARQLAKEAHHLAEVHATPLADAVVLAVGDLVSAELRVHARKDIL